MALLIRAAESHGMKRRLLHESVPRKLYTDAYRVFTSALELRSPQLLQPHADASLHWEGIYGHYGVGLIYTLSQIIALRAQHIYIFIYFARRATAIYSCHTIRQHYQTLSLSFYFTSWFHSFLYANSHIIYFWYVADAGKYAWWYIWVYRRRSHIEFLDEIRDSYFSREEKDDAEVRSHTRCLKAIFCWREAAFAMRALAEHAIWPESMVLALEAGHHIIRWYFLPTRYMPPPRRNTPAIRGW